MFFDIIRMSQYSRFVQIFFCFPNILPTKSVSVSLQAILKKKKKKKCFLFTARLSKKGLTRTSFYTFWRKKSFFFIYILYIQVKKSIEWGGKKSRPPDWPFFLSLGKQETLFYLRMASGKYIKPRPDELLSH